MRRSQRAAHQLDTGDRQVHALQAGRCNNLGGMAVAGLVMGYIAILPVVLFSIWFVFAGGMAALSGSSSGSTY